MSIQRDPAMDRARKRARGLRDFYTHFFIYLAVCTLLVVIDLANGSAGTSFIGLNWAYWPIFGWGIAVFMHGASVGLSTNDWEERKAAEFYERERNRELEHH